MNTATRIPAHLIAATCCLLVCCLGIARCQDAASPPCSTLSGPFDLVVVEATPGGIAMAVRAAREGLTVLLVNHNKHLGGIVSSGLGQWDTDYDGRRSPIFDEVRQAIVEHYRRTYGEKSTQYRQASARGGMKFEPRVIERVLTDLVAREKRITVLRGYSPCQARREGATLQSVTFREGDGAKTISVVAKVFADCTYEGDLLPLAKVPYRVGRESRSEFNEPHAGILHMRSWQKPPTAEAAALQVEHRRLHLHQYAYGQTIVLPQSTGMADGNVQAFNYRTILTSDRANRLPVEKPANYNPAQLKKLEFGSVIAPIPNQKIGWNRPQLVDCHQAYVEGDPTTRQRVMDEHWQATLALLYFLQNDDSVPEAVRRHWQQFGLARDEFQDNGHRPYEIYVREARRLVGRSVFTEHDALLAPGLHRAPVHAGSIGVTDWYMDAHACTAKKLPGCLGEGKMMLVQETFPGQVPYRTLLPQGIDNLLVPVCLSATHVGWGTIRLEPTWMNLAESAGYAVAQAVRHRQTPAQIDAQELLHTLVRHGVMVSFFNDVSVGGNEPWVAAVQFFGVHGFFPTYDARPETPLGTGTARLWAEGLASLLAKRLEPMRLMKSLNDLPAEADRQPVTAAEFTHLIEKSANVKAASGENNSSRGQPLMRREACLWMYRTLTVPSKQTLSPGN